MAAWRAGPRAWALLACWIGCTVYVWTTLDQGWIPHDEGTIAHAADRVLRGELPHRDFHDVYTGGQAMLHAAILQVRDDLMAPRILLFGFFVLWVPVFYWIARRFAGVRSAVAATLLAISVGVPLYPASMPSWYNLFFATFGLAGLLAWWQSERRGWLVFVGLMAGLSILFKVSGLYFLVAAVIGIFLREVASPGARRPGVGFPILLTAGAATLAISVTGLVVPRTGAPGFLHLALPTGAFCLTAVGWTWYAAGRNGPTAPGLRRPAEDLLALAIGCAVPIGLFAAPYIASGSVGDLLEGVFLLPTRRFEYASVAPPANATALFVPALVATFVIAELSAGTRSTAGRLALVGVLAMFFWASGSQWGYLASWFPLYYLTVMSVLGGCWLVADRTLRRDRSGDPSTEGRVLAVLSVAAVCALIQFPYAGSIYAAYTIPLAILALLAGLSLVDRRTGLGVITVLPYLAIFLAVRAHGGTVRELGFWPAEGTPFTERLALERGGILVTPAEKLEYEAAVALLRERARGDYILSVPDAPELYYLAGRRNPTRYLYEFFEDAGRDAEEMLATIRTHGIKAIAINDDPDFSEPLSDRTRRALAGALPDSATVGKFTVRWMP